MWSLLEHLNFEAICHAIQQMLYYHRPVVGIHGAPSLQHAFQAFFGRLAAQPLLQASSITTANRVEIDICGLSDLFFADRLRSLSFWSRDSASAVASELNLMKKLNISQMERVTLNASAPLASAFVDCFASAKLCRALTHLDLFGKIEGHCAALLKIVAEKTGSLRHFSLSFLSEYRMKSSFPLTEDGPLGPGGSLYRAVVQANKATLMSVGIFFGSWKDRQSISQLIFEPDEMGHGEFTQALEAKSADRLSALCQLMLGVKISTISCEAGSAWGLILGMPIIESPETHQPSAEKFYDELYDLCHPDLNSPDPRPYSDLIQLQRSLQSVDGSHIEEWIAERAMRALRASATSAVELGRFSFEPVEVAFRVLGFFSAPEEANDEVLGLLKILVGCDSRLLPMIADIFSEYTEDFISRLVSDSEWRSSLKRPLNFSLEYSEPESGFHCLPFYYVGSDAACERFCLILSDPDYDPRSVSDWGDNIIQHILRDAHPSELCGSLADTYIACLVRLTGRLIREFGCTVADLLPRRAFQVHNVLRSTCVASFFERCIEENLFDKADLLSVPVVAKCVADFRQGNIPTPEPKSLFELLA